MASTEALSREPGWQRYFEVRQRGSTVGTEVRAGVTTFMVMAYIIFVNPAILSFAGIQGLEGLGPPFPAVVAATCLVAALTTLLMGIWAKYPLALAPGMGLNAVVAFQLVAGLKLPWQVAMGVVFLEGVAITLFVLTGFRQAMMDAIPVNLKRAIGVGIGLFILFIGLYQGGFVRVPVDVGQTITAPPAVPLAIGNFTTLPFLIALIGLAITVFFISRGMTGGILWGILATTAVAMIIHAATGLEISTAPNKGVLPPQLVALPDFSTIGAGLNLEIFVRVGILTAILTIFSLMLSDFFDTMGTVIGIGGEAGWLDKDGRLPGLFPVLTTDSIAAMLGGIFGASSATTYIESAAGVAEGGRTGLTSVVVGVLFLLCLFLAPIAGIVPPEATAPALIVVGFYMCSVIREIEFADVAEGFPALLTMIVMPLTYSITNGIGAGFIAFTFIKLVTGRTRDLNWMTCVATVAFALYFALPWIEQAFNV